MQSMQYLPDGDDYTIVFLLGIGEVRAYEEKNMRPRRRVSNECGLSLRSAAGRERNIKEVLPQIGEE
jgi:hypothetical protein